MKTLPLMTVLLASLLACGERPAGAADDGGAGTVAAGTSESGGSGGASAEHGQPEGAAPAPAAGSATEPATEPATESPTEPAVEPAAAAGPPVAQDPPPKSDGRVLELIHAALQKEGLVLDVDKKTLSVPVVVNRPHHDI